MILGAFILQSGLGVRASVPALVASSGLFAKFILLLLLVIYVPFLQPLFNTVPLTLTDWLEMAPCFALASVAAELTKLYLRKRDERRFAAAS